FTAVPDRPGTFSDISDVATPRCSTGDSGLVENGTDYFAFRDGGRVFLVRIVTVADSDLSGLRLGRKVLDTLRVAPARASAPTSNDSQPRREPYRLYTHCGIEWAQIDGTWWQTDTPLSDGSGNPPRGWANPYQSGTLVFRDASTAEFQSSAGDVTFHR